MGTLDQGEGKPISKPWFMDILDYWIKKDTIVNTPKNIKILGMTKEQKSVNLKNLLAEWGYLTQSNFLRAPNSLGAPCFNGGT